MPRSVTANRACERFQLALELYELGERLMRQNLKRRHPRETKEQIEARLERWLGTRPGARWGDAAGRRGSWPPK